MAIHTFNILFLQVEMHRFVLYATLVGGWTAMAAIVVGGPAVLNTVQRGPFCAFLLWSVPTPVLISVANRGNLWVLVLDIGGLRCSTNYVRFALPFRLHTGSNVYLSQAAIT